MRIILFPLLLCLVSCSFDPGCPEALNYGTIEVIDNPGEGYVLAAPHGSFDELTGDIVQEVCEMLLWDCVIASGYRNYLYNTNRPTQLDLWQFFRGSPGEIETVSTQCVYDAYRSAVHSLYDEPLLLLVEIHGNSVPSIAHHLEIATVGIDDFQKESIRSLLNHNFIQVGITDVTVAMDGDPGFYWKVETTKTIGILNEVSPALHFETPKSLRSNQLIPFKAFLLTALPELTAQEFPE